jgi:hypothetical protein
MNGNKPHSVTQMKALKGTSGAKGNRMARFSIIIFAKFARTKQIVPFGKYDDAWREEWADMVY